MQLLECDGMMATGGVSSHGGAGAGTWREDDEQVSERRVMASFGYVCA